MATNEHYTMDQLRGMGCPDDLLMQYVMLPKADVDKAIKLNALLAAAENNPMLQAGNASWAQVELFRMQYGCLPGHDDMRPIDLEVAFKNAHKAVLKKEVDPFNAAMMLWYAGELLKGKKLGE